MKPTRVAMYIRVSKDEQKLHGLSLDAQVMKLKQYAQERNMIVVGLYADEGVSGRKLIRNRPELQRMLNDAQKDMFDLIIFIKLDRFFRSVAEYHECNKILKEHGVEWDATEEQYDTTTANGRMLVNMKLTIAELEADQTGERIKIVNDYKIQQKQAISGSVPFGFMLKKVDGRSMYFHDPNKEPIVKDYIDHLLQHHSLRGALFHINQKYSLREHYIVFRRLMNNTLLYGHYRGVDNFCEPYISKETFERIHEIIKSNIKVRKNKNTYIFTGLVKCPRCGCTLNGITTRRKNKIAPTRTFVYYRCKRKYMSNLCDMPRNIPEPRLEEYMLSHLKSEIEKYIMRIEVEAKKEENAMDKKQIKQIKSEMERLNTMFRKGRIKESEYDYEYDLLEKQLLPLELPFSKPKEDTSKLKEIMNSDFQSLYHKLTPENKRSFWKNIVKSITPNEDGTYRIEFL